MVSTATDLTTLQSADVDIGTHFHDFQVPPPLDTRTPPRFGREKKKSRLIGIHRQFDATSPSLSLCNAEMCGKCLNKKKK